MTATGTEIMCRRFVELITEYVEGSLDARTRELMEAHLSICPPCVTYVDQVRRTIELTGTVEVESLSDDAKAELVAAFRSLDLPG